ncbi:MAG: hypothetical protein V1760_00925 [Candidatus Peregrinibacteria bacterium]
MAKPVLSTEEKLDLILKYTKGARRWAVLRGVISLLVFIIFVVLPLIGGIYLYQYVKNIDLDKLQNIQAQFEEFKNLGEALKQFGPSPPR